MQTQCLKAAPLGPGRFSVSADVSSPSKNAGPVQIRDIRRWLSVWLVFQFAAWAFLSSSDAADKTILPFRIGFTSSLFTDVNEHDARAALKAWGQQIAMEQDIPVSPYPSVFRSFGAMRQAFQKKQVDAICMTTIEYNQLRRAVDFATIFVTYNAGRISEHYVLLAHRNGSVKTLADLSGRSLNFHKNPRASLSSLWLDTLMIRKGLPTAPCFAGKIFHKTKLSDVVLPVFFRQADACIVTRRGFDTISELNPQLARQLIVLEESPKIVPTIFALRADYNPVAKEKIITGMKELKNTPAGRQVLIIFQCDAIDEQPASCLDASLELIATHERLIKKDRQP